MHFDVKPKIRKKMKQNDCYLQNYNAVHFLTQPDSNNAKHFLSSRLPGLNKLLDIICSNRKTYF